MAAPTCDSNVSEKQQLPANFPTNIELGFVETTECWKLSSKYFPSKVGGRPAWLNLRDLPSPEQTRCPKCSRPLTFLLQVYAPLEEDPACFHRTIFVFFCRNNTCYSISNDAGPFVAFRCQLPRKNEFYDYEPPKENDKAGGHSAADFRPLCALCGGLGPKRCARCHTNYCSPEHQQMDWKLGHKQICKEIGELEKKPSLPELAKNSAHLLPEYEILTEPEETNTEEERTDEERMKDFEEFVRQKGGDSTRMTDGDKRDIRKMAVSAKDKQFQKFRKRIAKEPEQVLRYQRGGVPLWVSEENVVGAESVPPCECGAQRIFEFQILPQLLNHLKLDTLEQGVDWGTIAIYTCSNSCQTSKMAYDQEFVWKQDFSSESHTSAQP